TSVRGIVVAAAVLTATVVAVAWTLSLGATPSSTNAQPQPPPTTSRADPAVAFGAVPTEPAPSTVPAAATPIPPPSLVPSASQAVPVPTVVGAELTVAKGLLEAAGLRPGAVSARDSSATRGTVLSTAPDAATPVAPGATVDLVVASGSNVVPAVAGLSQNDAVTRLQSAGFGVAVAARTQQGALAGQVLSSDPAESIILILGGIVTLTVAAAPQPTSTAVPSFPGSTEMPVPSPTPARR
ncbi:MAG: eukaryotic-like serine/threonine-protein kinase, partial [Subtercola sp.]|nr:eukaryotic-like serine/threonine-protein kinase [Subtercola sp.]